MGFWTEQDVLEYIYKYELPIAGVYGDVVCENDTYRTTGLQRTGCMFCAFGAHLESTPNRFQQMAQTHPRLYRYCIKDLGMGEVLDYIDVPYNVYEEGIVSEFKDGQEQLKII